VEAEEKPPGRKLTVPVLETMRRELRVESPALVDGGVRKKGF